MPPAQRRPSPKATGGATAAFPWRKIASAVGGLASEPDAGDPSIQERSAALGDPLQPGSARGYQVYYRDPSPTFCPEPQGSTFNISNGMLLVW